MARKPRIEFSGAFYHIIARGNRRATIFHDDRTPSPIWTAIATATASRSMPTSS